MKNFMLIFLSIFLTACATMPAKQAALNQTMSWPARQTQLQHFTAWYINGAIAIRLANRGQTASLDWRQQQQNYQISLYGPLGAGRITLTGAKNSVLLFANGKQYQAQTPEILMQQLLGWHLPVQNLFYWIRGIPAPRLTSQLLFDDFHHLRQLKQQGWLISYQNYTAVDGYDLPSVILLKHNDLQLKIVISSWRNTN